MTAGAATVERSSTNLLTIAGGRHARQLVGVAALRLAGFASLIALWAYSSRQLGDVRLPPPNAVVEALRTNFSDSTYLKQLAVPGGYWSNTVYTVIHALQGFAIGSFIGFVLGLVSTRVQFARDSVTPALILFGAVPPLVAAPFMLVWFGIGPVSQTAVVILVCFVIVGINSQNAGLALAPHYEEVSKTLGVSRLRAFVTVVVPGSLPAVVGALRISLATAWSLQVAAELLGATEGVGRVISVSNSLGFLEGSMAIIIILGAIGGLLDLLLAGVLRWLGRWQATVSR